MKNRPKRVKKLQKDHQLSEDETHIKQDEIQKLTDSYIHKVDDAIGAKEKEVLEL